MSRFGPPFGPGGDGGKNLCDVEKTLGQRGCLVVSVGLNADTRFEAHLHRAWPGCQVEGMDGTLNQEKKDMLPKFISFKPINFDADTYKDFVHRRVSLLKIDCDGCEFTSLQPWVKNVCTEQIVVEVHRAKGGWRRIYENILNVHRLMSNLHAVGYRIAYLEANARYPILGTEYTLVRNATC